MTYDDCPHVVTVEVIGDSRIFTDHLAKVLAMRYALKLRGIPIVLPEDDEPRKKGLFARVFT
jgi:hypothetical protein